MTDLTQWRQMADEQRERLEAHLWELVETPQGQLPPVSRRVIHEIRTAANAPTELVLLASVACIVDRGSVDPARFRFDEVEPISRPIGWFIDLWRSSRRPELQQLMRQLVERQLEAGFSDVAARIIVARFITRYSPFLRWYTPVEACDHVARTEFHSEKDWLKLLIECGWQGRLSEPWMESPVRAWRRWDVGEASFAEKVRRYENEIGFETDYGRLAEIYEGWLLALAEDQEESVRARRALWRRIDQLDANPVRAQMLLELAIGYDFGGNAFTLRRQVSEGLRAVETLDSSPFGRKLFELYVSNLCMEPRAVDFVLRHRQDVDVEVFDDIDGQLLEDYLVAANDETTASELRFKFGGLELEYHDRLAVEKIKGYIGRRKRLGLGHLLAFGMQKLESEGMVDTSRVVSRPADTGIFIQSVVREILNWGELPEKSRDATELISRMEQLETRSVALATLFGALSFFPVDYYRLRYTVRFLVSSAGLSTVMELYRQLLERPDHRGEPFHRALEAVVLSGPTSRAEGSVETYFWSYHFFVSIFPELLFQSTERVPQKVLRFFEELIETRSPSRALFRAASEQISPSRAGFRGMVGAATSASLLFDLCETCEVIVLDRYMDSKYKGWTPLFPVNS